MYKLISTLIFASVILTLDSAPSNYKGGDSRVILFNSSKCKSECYQSSKRRGQCIWFQLGANNVSIPDLSTYTSYYSEQYDCKWLGGQEHGVRECKTRKGNFSWHNEANAIYLSDPRLAVILWEKPNYQGTSIRVWGKGCYDLALNGWGGKAESLKIKF